MKGTSAGLGALSTLKDLGVDISKNTQIDKTVLEVRIDASAGRGMAVRRGAGRVRHIATPTLRVRKLAQESEKHEQSMEYRTRQILEPNTLREDQFEGHRKDVIATFVKFSQSSCGQKCKTSRDPILMFSQSMMHTKLTRSQKQNWRLNSIDDESSDAVNLKQLRDRME